jgi:hypothetical protein
VQDQRGGYLPTRPWENGYCESFNSKLRDELLAGERDEQVGSVGCMSHGGMYAYGAASLSGVRRRFVGLARVPTAQTIRSRSVVIHYGSRFRSYADIRRSWSICLNSVLTDWASPLVDAAHFSSSKTKSFGQGSGKCTNTSAEDNRARSSFPGWERTSCSALVMMT